MAGKPSLTEAERKDVITLYQQRVDAEILCAKYGVWPDVINRILLTAGIEIRKKPGGAPRTAAETELAIISAYRGDHAKPLGSSTVAKQFSVSKKTVINIFARHGEKMRPRGALRPRAKDVNKSHRVGENDAAITKHYADGVPIKEIALLVGVHLMTVYRVLRKQGIFEPEGSSWKGELHAVKPSYTRKGYPRRSDLREDAFDELDPEAMYWAGFIMADGCIHKDITRPSYRLIVRLALHDREALERLKAWLGATVKIVTGVVEAEGRFKRREYAALQLTSNALCQKLMSIGIVERKSAASSNAFVTDDCFVSRDFWRGMVDGDGSVYKAGQGTCYLSGTKAITQRFMDYCLTLDPSCEMAQHYHKSHCGKEGCWVARVRRRAATRIVLDTLYRDAVWALPRKLALAKTHFTANEKPPA